MLRSIDSVSEEDGMHYAYPAEFLQQLNADGLPPALLCLKIGSPVILLRKYYNLSDNTIYYSIDCCRKKA